MKKIKRIVLTLCALSLICGCGMTPMQRIAVNEAKNSFELIKTIPAKSQEYENAKNDLCNSAIKMLDEVNK